MFARLVAEDAAAMAQPFGDAPDEIFVEYRMLQTQGLQGFAGQQIEQRVLDRRTGDLFGGPRTLCTCLLYTSRCV